MEQFMNRSTNIVPFGYEWLYLEINLFCVALLGMMLFTSWRYYRQKYAGSLIGVTVSACVSFLCDGLWVLMLDGVIPYQRVIFLLLKDGYFLSITSMCYLWMYYTVISLFGNRTQVRRKLKRASVLCYAEIFLLIFNWVIPVLFSANAAGRYFRGPLFVFQYMFGYVYAVTAGFIAFQRSFSEEQYADRRELRLFAAYPVAPAASGIIQFFVPFLPTLCCVITVLVMGIHLRMYSEMISLDPLTQLNNRRRFFLKVRQKDNARDRSLTYWILMMDIDFFKEINDRYGHPEGDRALRLTADAVTRAAQSMKHRAVIARYGGDEFILFVETEKDEEISRLRTGIENEITEVQKTEKLLYQLKLSIGSRKWEEGEPLSRTIEAADDALYEVKRKHHTDRQR